jgi:hypothetical protein
MSVHEDPDELGYWKEPLSRSAAQEDLGPQSGLAGAGRRAAARQGPFLTDVLPWEEQRGIVRAVIAAEEGDHARAEDYRNAVGYSEHIQ